MELFSTNSNINFMRLRYVSLIVAALVMFVAIGAMTFKGFNFALDFTGGYETEVQFSKTVDVNQLRTKLEKAGYNGAQVRVIGSSNDVVIRMSAKQDGTKMSGSQVVEALQSVENPATLRDYYYIGPQVGKELAENGILAVAFVVFGFLAYVWMRFELKFAIAAIITTLHDVILVCGWFALFGKEFDLTVLAGVLSVMGYSINDTIVVFDRVRENFKTLHKLTPIEIMNRSVNQTLSRTIITSFVALLTVLALFFYGGESLRGMAESQILGIVIGTLSSIFVACPLLLLLGVTKQDLLPKARADAELDARP
ncbi:MAG: protein translocase subunit SecF [Arenimonas sp.]|nr:protein translocase subunit SecF [Arenimonas sp.]MBP6309488.1 protein translocase subunit SecF [Arenimonas sp.]